MALVRTDYGLIYNTDGSLCATLLPEGGVAIEEKGRENLLATASAPAEEVVTVVPGDTYTLSVYGNDPSSSGTVTEAPDYYASFNNHANIVTKNGDIISPEAGGVYTLLPGGGVAVTEGTTNLCDPAYMYTNTWTTIDYSWGRRTFLNCTAGDVFTISADIRNLSQGEDRRWGKVSFRDSGGIELEFHNARDSGMSEQRLSFTTPPAPAGTVEARVYWLSRGSGVSYQGKNFQIEKKPFDTPFVKGTRPDGSLSYDLPISINGDWTIAKWLELEPYFMDKSRSGDNSIRKFRMPLLELGEKYYTEGYGVIGVYGAWESNRPGNTINIMANKDTDRVYSSMPDTITLTEAEYNNKILAVLTKSGSMLTAYIYTVGNKYVLTCNIASLGDISQITPRLNYHTVTTSNSNRMYSKRHLNTLVCPYSVSPETVATWHNRGLSIGSATPEAPLTFIPSIETLRLVPTNLTKWQLEKGDKANPFVIGYASPGRLQYQTNLSLLQSGTIAFTVWTPKTEWDQSHNALLDVGGILQLKLDADGIEGCPITVNQKYKCVVTWENGANTKLYINGELWKTWDTLYSEAGDGIVRFGCWKDDLDSVNTLRFENVLIRPEVVTAETVATWHSLDAPFFDPREQIDSVGRPLHGAGWNADQHGLRSNLIVPETGRAAFEIEPSGNAYFGGELRAGIVVDESISNDSTIAKLYSSGRISMPIGLWDDNTYGYDILLPDVINFDQLGVIVNYLTWGGTGGLIDGVWKVPADFPMYTYNINTGVYTRVPTQMVKSAVVLNVCPKAWWRQTSGDRVRLEAAVTYIVAVNGQTLPWYSIRTPAAADAGVHSAEYFIAIKQHWG